MKTVLIVMEEYLYAFYAQVGARAGGIPPEQVMADALFKLAGELSLHAVSRQGEAHGEDESIHGEQ